MHYHCDLCGRTVEAWSEVHPYWVRQNITVVCDCVGGGNHMSEHTKGELDSIRKLARVVKSINLDKEPD